MNPQKTKDTFIPKNPHNETFTVIKLTRETNCSLLINFTTKQENIARKEPPKNEKNTGTIHKFFRTLTY